MRRIVIIGLSLAVVGAVAVWCWGFWSGSAQPDVSKKPTTAQGAKLISEVKPAVVEMPAVKASEPADSEDVSQQDAEEKLVEAFDNLTDKWMEPSAKGVSVNDVDAFIQAFKRIPKSRQEECMQRALNLIPDENVMLLAGALMDKSLDKEIVELVFNDVLNRDEDVKKPIMQQIFKDRTHPCWADVAWILDVTGEVPAPTGR